MKITSLLKRNSGNIIVYFVLIVLSIVWIFPIVWVLLTSFRSEPGQFVQYFIPHGFTLDNYKKLLGSSTSYPFMKWFFNTAFVATCSCILSTFITLSMSYTLSRMHFKMRKPIMKISLILNMFPAFMSMIAIYYILKSVNLTQSLLALILVYSAITALNFYVAKGFFDIIPKSLDESAKLDGATQLQIFTKIILPLSKPMIVYTSLLAFVAPWMDFIIAKVIMGDNYDKYTVAIGLYSLLTKENVNENFTAFAAGCVIVAIPIALLFIMLQKYYVEGITGGSVKG